MAKTETLTYTCCGALGDLVHLLYVIHTKYLLTEKKGNLVLCAGEFRNGLESTCRDIYKFIMRHDYINFCVSSTKEDAAILQKNQPQENLVDLDAWRHNQYVRAHDWYHLLMMTYDVPLIPGPWIKCEPNPGFSSKIVVHTTSTRNFDHFPWEKILTRNEDCIFVSCYKEEYQKFKYWFLVDFYQAANFEELVDIIGGCKYFVGNQSCPLAIACALNKPCLGELYTEVDVFYTMMSDFTDWFSWISSRGFNLKNAQKYIGNV